MPAAAVILPLGEMIFGDAIASAVTGTLASAGITLASGTLGAIETGAIIGAGEGAVNAAVSGGDIAKGAFMGGVGGGVGAGVGSEVSSALSGPSGSTIGPMQPNIGGIRELGSAAVQGASSGAGSLAASLAGGSSLSSALQSGLRSGALGAIGGLASGVAKYDLGTSPSDASTIGAATKQLAGYALPSATTSGGTTQYMAPQTSLNLQGPTTAAPSATLGQSLSIAPSLGYTPGGTVFGSSDTDSKKSNVWNVGSLRNVGAAEA